MVPEKIEVGYILVLKPITVILLKIRFIEMRQKSTLNWFVLWKRTRPFQSSVSFFKTMTGAMKNDVSKLVYTCLIIMII